MAKSKEDKTPPTEPVLETVTKEDSSLAHVTEPAALTPEQIKAQEQAAKEQAAKDAAAREQEAIAAAARARAEQINTEAHSGNPFVDAVPPEGEEDTGPGIARKITPKDVLQGNIRDMVLKNKIKLYAEDGTELKVPLFSVFGRASNIREGESNFGPWTSLVGEFEAKRASDGAEFASTECIVPGPAGELLVKAVRAFITEAIPVTPEEFKLKGRTFRVTGESVELALMIFAVPNKRAGGAPYEFIVEPIIKLQRSDALAALRARANKHLLAAKQAHLAALPPPAAPALENKPAVV